MRTTITRRGIMLTKTLTKKRSFFSKTMKKENIKLEIIFYFMLLLESKWPIFCCCFCFIIEISVQCMCSNKARRTSANLEFDKNEMK